MAWNLAILQWLIHAALGGCVFLTIGCLAVCFCKQPVRRLRLIELTLLGCLVVPWLNQFPGLPHWSLGWLNFAAPAVGDAAVAQTEEPTLEHSESAPAALAPANLLAVKPIEEPGPALANPPAPAPQSVNEPASAALAPSRAAEVVSTPLVVVIVYGCAVLGLILWWLAGMVQLYRLHATTYSVPSTVADLFRSIAGPTAESVRLLASDRIELPLTFSGWRPVIVLPGSLCKEGDSPALQYCLAHEWSHVERHDAWRWYLATLAQFFFFYQPLFWWLRRQLRLCQDYLADARAAEQAADAEDYAAYLVSLARRRLGAPAALTLGISDGRSNLYRRIVMLLQNRQPLERRCLGLWNLGITLAAVVLLAAVAVLRLDAGAPVEKKDPAAKEEPKKEEPKKDEAKAETLHYTGRVFDKDTEKGIPSATVTVRRSLLGDPELKERNPIVEETKHQTDAEGKYSFTIPPEQVAKRYLYIELDVEAPNYAPRKHFGYALSMIRKNEKIGGRPFFENVDLRRAKEITGVLKTPDDQPAAGVKVMAYSNTDKKSEMFEYGSFADARTDAKGRFSIWVITPGPAYLWLLPEKYVPETHILKDNKRGDLGAFVLREGIVIRGKLLDAQGKPLAGVNVNAESQDGNEEITLPVADNINRSGVSNDKGEFEMNPLPPGNYQIKPDVFARDASKDDRQQRKFDAVFIAKKLTLKAGEKPEPIEVRAAPHVVIEAQAYDSKGKKARSHEFFVFGQIDGTSWFGQAKGDPDGHLVARIPHGLEGVQLDLMTNEHGSLRWRRGDKGELHNQRRVELGTVNEDVKDLQIIRYEAPILIVKLKGPEGAELKDTAVTADYAEGKNQYGGKMILANGRHSDVSFEHQEDGRFRSEQLFPDEEVSVVGHADGYESKPVKIKLPEAEKKEIEIVLEKAEKKEEKKEDKK
jgi:beta-lactamase regulating signal transducer with metallopeptidase domain